MFCRLELVPDGEVILASYEPGITYEEILLANGINPDIVLIRSRGTFLPQDHAVKEENVEIILTCSRG